VRLTRSVNTGSYKAKGGSMIAGMNRLELFVSRDRINPFIDNALAERFAAPISFITSDGSRANGFEAILLADLCEAVLKAREAGKLQKQQEGIAMRCELLVRGFARVGIIALVDEATGYQKDRARGALARILEAFIAKELQPFPDPGRHWAGTGPPGRRRRSGRQTLPGLLLPLHRCR